MPLDPILSSLITSSPLGIAFWLLLNQFKSDRAERLQYDKDRLDMDKKLVAAMTTLAMKITGRPIDGD